MSPRPFAIVLLALSGLPALALAAAPSPELAPYVTLVRGESGRRVLETVREALCVAAGRCDSTRSLAPDWPAAPRPVFVTLARGAATRACIGSDEPQGSLTETLRRVAAEAMVSDRRRPPIEPTELDALRVLVAFVGDEHPVAEPWGVDPMREGLRVTTDRGSVAFLPGEARTVSWALAEARRIGVFGAASEARYTRFSAVVVSGPAVVAADRTASRPPEVRP